MTFLKEGSSGTEHGVQTNQQGPGLQLVWGGYWTAGALQNYRCEQAGYLVNPNLANCLTIHINCSIGIRRSIHKEVHPHYHWFSFVVTVDESPRRENQKRHIVPKFILDLFIQWCKYGFTSLIWSSNSEYRLFYTALFLLLLLFWISKSSCWCSMFTVQLFFRWKSPSKGKIIHCLWPFIFYRLREDREEWKKKKGFKWY